jgi:hypothetical protein
VPASVQQFQRPGVVYRHVQGAVPGCETSLVWQRSSPALERFMAFRAMAGSSSGHNVAHADPPPN